MRTPVLWPRPPIPIEEYEYDSRYVLRAELPGLDPARDITVMVADGELTVEADRVAWSPHHHIRSEFRYGTFRRRVSLPRRARDETTTASYDGGILEVRVQMARRAPIGRTVPVDGRDPAGGGRPEGDGGRAEGDGGRPEGSGGQRATALRRRSPSPRRSR